MSTYNLTEMIAQRKEATGVDGDLVSFDFTATAGDQLGETLTFTFRDPLFLSDDELAEAADLDEGPDVCAWYMGEDEYDRFIDAGGSSNLWALVMRQHTTRSQEVGADGRPTRQNRSSRRAARRR